MACVSRYLFIRPTFLEYLPEVVLEDLLFQFSLIKYLKDTLLQLFYYDPKLYAPNI